MYWEAGTVIAQMGELKVAFRQVGVLRTTITVRSLDSDIIRAVYKAGWGNNGTLTFMASTEPKIKWQQHKSDEYRWANEQGESLLTFKMVLEKIGKTGQVEIETARQTLPEFQLLLLLGWYLAITKLGTGTDKMDTPRDGTPGNGGPSFSH